MNVVPPSPASEVVSGPENQSRASLLLSYVLWPVIALCAFSLAYACQQLGVEDAYIVAIVFLALAFTLGILEHVFPHERVWKARDGQLKHDMVFVAVGSGVPGAIAEAIVLAIVTGAAQWIARQVPGGLWPTHWPQLCQIGLVILVGDFGGYWAHRLFHTTGWMWPYHAVHHTVPRLWWLNSGRAHPFDTALIILFSMPLLLLLGAPDNIILWLSITTSIIGMLSHCNINMRCGWLDWIFNTPNVHRWHHSRILVEGNSNYGENTMIWDLLFRTHYRQAHRRPPTRVGTDTPIPASISGQFIGPLKLSWQALKAGKNS